MCPGCSQSTAACDAEGLATVRHHALAKVIRERDQALAKVAATERKLEEVSRGFANLLASHRELIERVDRAERRVSRVVEAMR